MDSKNDLKIQNQNKKESAVKSSFFFFILVFICAIAVDQISKHFATRIFHNSDFAFSLALPTGLMYGIYFIIFATMVYYAIRNYRGFSFTARLAWAFIFAGAISNIVERIFVGYVRDFIYITFLKWTGIYNLADFFIIAGIILLLIPRSRLNHKSNDL